MQNVSIECTIEELGEKVQKLVTQYLEKDEKPLLCIKSNVRKYRVGVITENKVIIVFGDYINGIELYYASVCINMKDIRHLEHFVYDHGVEIVPYSIRQEYRPTIFFSDVHQKDKFVSVLKQACSASK